MSESSVPLPQPQTAEPAERRSLRERFGAFATSKEMVPIWFGVILLLGAALRFIGLDWDAGQHLHPDERFLTWVVSDLRWPAGFGEYINEAGSPLNPRNVGHTFFVYGTLPTTIVKGVAILLDRDTYDQVYLVGRALSGMFDLGSVVFLFLLARKLYRDSRIALLAAFFLSTTVLAIQHAHFFVTDPFANFFIVGALYFLARVQIDGGISDYLLTGVFFGLAMASKISVFTFAGVVTLVGAYRVWQVWVETRDGDAVVVSAERTFIRLVLTALAAFVVFRIAQPDAFSGPGLLGILPAERWLSNMSEVRKMVSGEVDFPPGHQWTNRAAYLFPLKNMVVWGMGIPLGIAAWAGTLVAGWRMMRERAWMHLIPVTWILILFAHQGGQWVKSLRYFLPIYPTLALMAAWLLIWLWDRATADDRVLESTGLLAWTPAKAGTLLGVVAVGTLLWATAFTSIYTRPHSRIQASRWMYENIPSGSVIANEHWDDALPLRIDGKDPYGSFGYSGVTMEWYGEDRPEKLEQALDWLDQADYIVLSSNRLYDSIPRLPMRYPMTVNYYDALFDGRLGFERVAEFTSYPQLFGIEIPDQGAEEAFSVYDHPRVQIFEKAAAYDRSTARDILTEDVEWDRIIRMWPKEATKAPTALRIPEEELDEYRSAGTWSRLFDRDGIVNRLPVVFWALVIELLGFIAAPFLFVAGSRLPDRGYALAKTLGLLLAGWLIWMLASLDVLDFSRWAIWLVVLVLAAGAAGLARAKADEWREYWRTHRHVILTEEVLFWGFFALVLGVRWANPDLWHPILGGEKPMDFAYLNAIIKSPQFPPYDPWFAGGYINYYYFGFVLVAMVIKATGVVPHIAYNLAIPTLFAMTAMGAFGAALALVHVSRGAEEQGGGGVEGHTDVSAATPDVSGRDLGYGVLGASFVAVIGNLGELKLILDGFADMSTLSLESRLPGFVYIVKVIHGFVTGFLAGEPLNFRIEWWYWNATRVIDHPPEEAGPITEMPWFSFLYADLHAHVMALPLTLLAVGLALAVLRSRERGGVGEILRLGLLGLTVGALWPTNTWDFPAYAVLVLVALVLREWWRAGSLSLDSLFNAGWRWGVVLVLSYAMYQPFHQWYGSAYTSVQRWSGSRTPLADYLIIHGFFLFIIVAALFTDFWFGKGHNGMVRSMRAGLRHWYRFGRLARLHRALVNPGAAYGLGLYAIGVLGLLGLALMVVGLVVPGVIVWLLTFTGMLALRRRPNPRWQMALAFVGLGLALTFLVEFIVLKGDIARMNTVFKFYLQVWVLFGLASALGASLVWDRLARWAPAWRTVWRWGFVALFAATLLYPIFSTQAKIDDRFNTSVGPTLNGMAFMGEATYHDQGQTLELKWDKQAIEWMQDNVAGSPVIAEAQIHPTLYGWGNRYAMFTGLPAIIGWHWHQQQQRAVLPGDVVMQRVNELQQIYNTTDPNEAYRMLRSYGAEYVVVGPLERAYYDAAGIEKFEPMRGILWDLVYENQEVRIYRVLE